MPILIVPVGVAASGKTTWWHKQRNWSYNISADSMRYELYDYDNGFKKEYEDEVWASVWKKFIHLLKESDNIYLDNTNLTKFKRSPFINVARAFGYKIRIIFFDGTIIQILQQNMKRSRRVPDEVICRQIIALQYPEPSEYDSIKTVSCGMMDKW